MIRSVIIDDELKSRDILSTLVTRYCDGISIAGNAESVESAIEAINSFEPELVFLDISMPDGSGFDLLQQLEVVDFEVIFTTAYNEYALQAIKADAVDYLLKPINIRELQAAVQKATGRITDRKYRAGLNHATDRPLNIYSGKIAIPDNNGLQFIAVDSIIYIEAKGTYSEFYCMDGSRYLSSKSLKDYEQLLPLQHFFRAHHSYIINLSYVQNYHKGNGGFVTMQEGTVIDISKRRKKQFLELFHA